MPTPCGLGLKFTVGTAVSVPPLGQEVKRQRRSGGPGTTKGGRGKGGRGDKKTFNFLFCTSGILSIKIWPYVPLLFRSMTRDAE